MTRLQVTATPGKRRTFSPKAEAEVSLPPSTRILIVEAETRRMIVPAEDRIIRAR